MALGFSADLDSLRHRSIHFHGRRNLYREKRALEMHAFLQIRANSDGAAEASSLEFHDPIGEVVLKFHFCGDVISPRDFEQLIRNSSSESYMTLRIEVLR